MQRSDKTLSNAQKAILKARTGSRLETVEGYFLYCSADITIYQVARLRFSDDTVLDVHNTLESMPIGEPDELEDVGIMSLEPSDGSDIWIPAGEVIETEVLNAPVVRVGVIVDNDLVLRDGMPINEMRFSQALVFDTGTGYVSIDKGPFTEDFLYLRVTGSLERCARDTREDWRCDEPYSDIFTRSVDWL